MGDDQFYEADEPIEELRAAWDVGEPGTTAGPRDLNQRAKSVVDRAVARFEGRGIRLRVVASGTAATTTTESGSTGAEGPLLDRVGDEPVSAVEYLVG